MAISWERVEAVARWLGQVAALANKCQPPLGEDGRKIRDSEAVAPRRNRPKKPRGQAKPAEEPATGDKRPLGDLSLCPRWAAVRSKQRAAQAPDEVVTLEGDAVGSLSTG